jgi:hypothetical protein
MQRNSQLHDSKAGAQMAARHRYGVDRLPAQFIRHLMELARMKFSEIFGEGDLIEEGGFRICQSAVSALHDHFSILGIAGSGRSGK